MIDTVVFRIGLDNWDILTLRQVDNGQNLMFYINGSPQIVRFQLTDNPKTNIFCEWSFFSSENGLYLPRPLFWKQNNDLPVDSNNAKDAKNPKVRIDLSKGEIARPFWEMISYFRKFKQLVDLGRFEDNLTLEEISNSIDSLENNQKFKLIEKISDKYSYVELESLLNRCKVKSVEQFASNLCNEDFKEKDWQDFFEKNKWMLSTVSTKLIFANEDMIGREETPGMTDNQNHGSSRVDYLAYNGTCTFIELKTPQTKIFRGSKNRTNVWSLSSPFIDGVSQCLGQINSIVLKKSYDKNKRRIDYSQQCPRSIFVIGNLKEELKDLSDQDKDICKDTFESFRHNSKNVEVITYDELYERVKYIATQIKLLE